MTGTKFGCGKTLCRACTVHLDGEATFRASCRSSSVAKPQGHHHRRVAGSRGAGRPRGVGSHPGAAMRLLPARTGQGGAAPSRRTRSRATPRSTRRCSTTRAAAAHTSGSAWPSMRLPHSLRRRRERGAQRVEADVPLAVSAGGPAAAPCSACAWGRPRRDARRGLRARRVDLRSRPTGA